MVLVMVAKRERTDQEASVVGLYAEVPYSFKKRTVRKFRITLIFMQLINMIYIFSFQDEKLGKYFRERAFETTRF